jgi:hypothetical protein
MNHNAIKLDSMSRSFEFEKLSRDIDSISDTETLRDFAKSYLKLYLSQQEVIANLKF